MTDNWFWSRRRTQDLAQALRRRGMALPAARSLFGDIDIEPMAEAFIAWHRTRHGTEPDPEAVDALAAEWLEGSLPGTQHAASPHRARHLLTLITDWIAEDPVTVPAKALLPEWVRWNGERAGLPEHLLNRAVAVAAGGPGPATDCCRPPSTGARQAGSASRAASHGPPAPRPLPAQPHLQQVRRPDGLAPAGLASPARHVADPLPPCR